MNKLTKVVNIYPSMPIIRTNPPIRSAVKNVTKSVDEIRICLMSRAIVEEVLPDGTTVRLNISNYDKDSNKESKCECGGKCTGWVVKKDSDNTKSPWRTAYENALNGKDLRSMTRKQRRSAEAAARAVADAAIAEPKTEVVMGVIEVAEEPIKEAAVEETVVAEEIIEAEEVVETVDVEDVPEISE